MQPIKTIKDPLDDSGGQAIVCMDLHTYTTLPGWSWLKHHMSTYELHTDTYEYIRVTYEYIPVTYEYIRVTYGNTDTDSYSNIQVA